MTTQTDAQYRSGRPDHDEVGLNGWQAFAAIILLLNGFFSFLFGLTAVLNEDVLVVGGRAGVIILDFTAWGIILMTIGALMVTVSIGLFRGSSAARVAAIAIAGLNALLQFGTASAFPLWSLLVIALDVIIIYQLTARWRPA